MVYRLVDVMVDYEIVLIILGFGAQGFITYTAVQ